MTADVAGDLPAAGGMAHQRDVSQVECLDDGREVVGVAVHVVPGCGLAGPAVAAAVVGDYAEPVLREEVQLGVPRVGAQRPAMRERHDGTAAPVLVVDLGTVGGDDRGHCLDPFPWARAAGEPGVPAAAPTWPAQHGPTGPRIRERPQ